VSAQFANTLKYKTNFQSERPARIDDFPAIIHASAGGPTIEKP
jgi:hypothetical protein